MKLREIVRFEIAYQWSRLATKLYGVGFAGLTLLLALAFIDDARRDGFLFNSPIVIAISTVILSMIGLLVTAAVAGDAATRDVHARIEPLLYSTPLRKATYFGGRFLGAFALGAMLIAAVPLVLAASTLIPGLGPAVVGPFRPGAYVIAYVYFALPNVFIATALLFAVSAVTRRAMAGYLTGVVLFMGSGLTEAVLAEHLGKWGLAKLVDPFANVATKAMWRSWTAVQSSTRPVDLGGPLLTNRLLWIGIALAALALAHARFRMAHHAGGGRNVGQTLLSVRADRQECLSYTKTSSPTRRLVHSSTRLRQFLALTLASFKTMVTSRAALLVPVIAAVMFVVGPELMEVSLGTPGRPVTGRLATLYGRFPVVAAAITALIAYFAGQLVWRERDARLADIADAAPVPDSLMFSAKCAGLALMLAATQLFLMATAIVTQLTRGYDEIEPLLHLEIFGLQLIDYLLFAALAMFVHVLVNQKYVATTIVLLCWIFTTTAGQLGIQHNLLVFGAAPTWAYSDISGFAGTLAPWAWFKAYWAGWALLFAVLARLLWIRGNETGFRARLGLARRRLAGLPGLAMIVAVLLLAGAGGFVFYNTNVRNEYRTADDAQQQRAEYERRYGRYAALAQPIVAATKLRVELHPAQHSAHIRGTYRLENRTGVAIDAVHLVTHRDVPPRAIAFDRPSRVELADARLGYQIHRLDRPLRPGESVTMQFTLRVEPRGFTNAGISTAITENGSYFEHLGDEVPDGRRWLPVVGYQRSGELDGAGDRRRYGLRARPETASLYDAAARSVEAGREQIDFEAVIGTDPDQTAVAPGALRRTWMEHGRRWFHYAADVPIRNGYAIFSARYAVHDARWNGVAIQVLHHPGHAWNVQQMVRSVQATLAYHTREFGPYPHKQLRLVEYPNMSSRLTAHAGTIMYAEVFSYANAKVDQRDIDLPFAVIAHEVAHQWWGHQVIPANVEGAPVLTESLAWYSAMMTIEHTLGREQLQRLVNMMRNEYLTPRIEPSVPLLRATDRFDVYRTGPFAMNSLRESVGEAHVNAALRGLLATHGKTSLDLYAQLRAHTPPSSHALLKDLFEDITFWDLRMKNVKVDGRRVTLTIEAFKLKSGRKVPMDDAMDIAVFDAAGAPLYRQSHRIHAGAQTIVVTVAGKATSAAVDPDDKLLDRNRGDNLRQVGAL